MTHSQLVRAIAYATGESRRTIDELGFSLADPMTPRFDPEPADLAKFLDWDEVDAGRQIRLTP